MSCECSLLIPRHQRTKTAATGQGARNPSEFDITSLANLGEDNVLAVRVYQFTDGSYIEDQDQWWLSGIFRDVFLLGFPRECCIEDVSVQTLLDDSYEDAVLKASITVRGSGEVMVKLLDASKNIVASATQSKSTRDSESVAFGLPINNPAKWTAETPYLYNLVISVNNNQFTAHRVGFRVVELKDGLIKINGKRVCFKGANRHEHHPTKGRAVPYEFMKQDLLLMKTHNINAIRTSHQPSDPRLYDLADELGFWVMDEADLECHGFETIADAALPPEQRGLPFFERQMLTKAMAGKWTSDNPEWRDAYIDRAQQLVYRDKIHPSVIIWSLGNEAFYGRNHTAMRDWIKAYDPTRLIHYEPDLEAKTMDMHSRMYPHVNDIIAFAKDTSKSKPLVLCEYIHAMGTGPGNIKEYIDAFYNYPSLQGGWVWEWANHGLLTKTDDGRAFYGYGGDFGDTPNDSNFVMDGVVNSDHSPRSALVEYKKALEPVQLITVSADKAKIVNRFDFDSLDHLECSWSISSEAGVRPGGHIDIPRGIAAGTTAELRLPEKPSELATESFLDLKFALKEKTLWAEAGHEVAFLQVPWSSHTQHTTPAASQATPLQAKAVAGVLSISSEKSQWKLDLIRGSLSAWQKDGKQIIAKPLEPSFYRAPTDNDRGMSGSEWQEKFLYLATNHTRSFDWYEKDGLVTVEFEQKFAPPVLSWTIDLKTKYVFSPDGSVKLQVTGNPTGQNLPENLARIGVTLGLEPEFQNVKWYGRGPRESYKDMKLSQRVALHSVSHVEDLWEGPEFPQECSNRTDTRWLEMSSPDTSLTAQFLKSAGGDGQLFDFMASHYDVKDIDEAQHPYQLKEKRQEHIVLRLDADHHGLGTGSCGPATLDEYALKTQPFDFVLLLH